jgi:hypothetical protein
MHIAIWVKQGWYTKNRGYQQWKKKMQYNESNPTFLSLEKICGQCGDENAVQQNSKNFKTMGR